MENFLQRLARNPYQPIDGASITRVDELGNGYDDWNNLIQPKFEAPQQTWGETALGVATAPARMATALAGSLSPYGQDGWQVPPAAQEGWNALTAVGDAYTQGMSEDELRNRALGMAGFMMGGGGIAAGRAPMIAANASKEGAIPGIVASQSGSFPMDQASIRAYHGMDGPVLGGAFDGPSFWATDRPATASRYAEGLHRGPQFEATAPNVLPVDMAGKVYDATGLENKIGIFDIARQNAKESGADIIKYIGGNYEAINRGTVRSATTGETLFSNADSKPALLASGLDMGQEARLARARDMGFDTSRTLYHGTDRDFESFNPSQSGAYGPGVYVTPDADYASRYAVGRSGWEQDTRIMPLHVRGELADGMLYEALKREVRATGVPEDKIGQAVQQQLREMGYSGVEGTANQAVAVFDPANIRSTNAAFDPAQSSSANLLAANADSRPALLGAGQEQDIPDWLLPYLR